MVAVDQVGEPCGISRWSDEGIEFEFVHDKINALRATELMIQSQRIEIFFRTERTLLLGFDKNVLSKVRHFTGMIVIIELDHIFQILDRGIPPPGEISREVGFEFVIQDGRLAVGELANGWNVGGLHDLSPRTFHLVEERIYKLIQGVVETEILPHHSEARAFESGRVEKLCIVRK